MFSIILGLGLEEITQQLTSRVCLHHVGMSIQHGYQSIHYSVFYIVYGVLTICEDSL